MQANVNSVAAVEDVRIALLDFQKRTRDALATVYLECRRASDWLEERRQFWGAQIRIWQEEVVRAKSILSRKQTVTWGERVPDTTEEEKALRYAQARLRQAEDKLDLCKAWGPRLRRAIEECEGPTRRLGDRVDSELPRLLATFAQMILALEQYLGIATPTVASPPPPPPAAPAENTP